MFLEAITDGPLDPMFSTLLLAFLETKDTTLSVEHKIFSLEFMSLSAQGLLTPTTFADTILDKPNVYLTGLHILFDDNLRLRRELRREGLELLDAFKINFIQYTAESDLSKSPEVVDEEFMARNVKRLTMIGRQNQSPVAIPNTLPGGSVVGEQSSCIDEEPSQLSSILVESTVDSIESGKHFDVLLSYCMYCFGDDTLDVNDDSGLPYYLKCFDVYCAYVALKCVSNLTEVTKTFSPLVDINELATAIRHRELVLVRSTLYGWFDYIDNKKQRVAEGHSDDSEDEMEECEDNDVISSNQRGRRREGRAAGAFTATKAPSMNALTEEEGEEEWVRSDDD